MWNVDVYLLQLINSGARKSALFDFFVVQVLDANMIRATPIVACLVWLWFSDEGYGLKRRAVAQGLFGASIALIASRLIQNFWTHRPRPLHNPDVVLTLPFDLTRDVLKEWSSFPSDNASLVFALAAGVFIASRAVGIAALAWALVAVGLARLYAGYHYPSDILGGAVLGVLGTVVCRPLVHSRAAEKAFNFALTRTPGLFYVLGFLLLMQIVTNFDEIRWLASATARRLGASLQ